MRFTCMCFPRKVFPNVCLITKPELSFNRLTYVLPVLQALPCHLSYFSLLLFFYGGINETSYMYMMEAR